MEHSSPYMPHESKVAVKGCITLVGMAGAGKTTIGKELSALIGWPSIDSDNVIESLYGVRLQEVTNRMSKEAFLDLEAQTIQTIKINRAIISTGGSVVYRQSGMDYLISLGPVIYIAVPLEVILERIARKPERGLAIEPGQTVEDLYHERAALYEKYATWTVNGGVDHPALYAKEIAQWLATPA